MNKETATASATYHVQGEPPWFANMAQVMDKVPALLDRPATEFAPIAAKLNTQSSYWISFHMWVVDRLIAAEMAGTARDALREAVWVIYASAYWSMLELQLARGIPPAVINLGMTATAPSQDSVANMVAKLAIRNAAIADGGDAPLRLLPALTREVPCTGTLHGAAYNTGYVEVISERPPLGEIPARLRVETGSIRANARDFLRVDYALPAPRWLRRWRTTFEIAVRANPERFEQIISGGNGEENLRGIWAEALAWGHNNWGGQSLTDWEQEYFDDTLYWSIVYNFGLEAIALASFVALLGKDEAAATCAVRGNALYLGSWGAAVMGLLDTQGKLPKVISM